MTAVTTPESQPDGARFFAGRSPIPMSIGLFILTALVYWPACNNGFVNFDDNLYVTEQPHVLTGLRFDNLAWAATAGAAYNWHPLTWWSLQLDVTLFGTGPAGFQRTAVILHAVNAVLAYLAFRSLTGSHWRSGFVAALFAFHPLHVESVAWIAERKDLLSGGFFFLTLIAYARFVACRSTGAYLLVMLCFGLGLSAKCMLVTVPCVLLLLDYWPLRRLPELNLAAMPTVLRLIWEKLPLFALSIGASLATIACQDTAISTLERFPLGTRVGNAICSLFAYCMQTGWPVGLSPFYAYHEIESPQLVIATLALVVITRIAIWQVRRRPELLVGWLWFVGMLVPVIGLVQVGGQSRADRYMYLPQLGLFLAGVWCVADLLVNRPRSRFLVGIAAISVLGVMAFLTVRQIPVWHDPVSLWTQALLVDPDNCRAHCSLMQHYVYAKKRERAVWHGREAIRTVDPRHDFETLINTAMRLAELDAQADCEAALTRGLQIRPHDAELYGNRGKARSSLGKWSAAADDFQRAAELNPKGVANLFYRAHALDKMGRTDESRQLYEQALRQAPRWPQNAARMAWTMSTDPSPRVRVGGGWPALMAEQANTATGGNQPELLDVLAAAYAEATRFDEAISTAEQARTLAEAAEKPALVEQIESRLELYRRHQPYRAAKSVVDTSK